MTDEAILSAISDITRDHLGWTGRLDPGLPLSEGLGLDSIKLMTLALEVENHFKIALDPERDQDLTTVADLVNAIKARLDADTNR